MNWLFCFMLEHYISKLMNFYLGSLQVQVFRNVKCWMTSSYVQTPSFQSEKNSSFKREMCTVRIQFWVQRGVIWSESDFIRKECLIERCGPWASHIVIAPVEVVIAPVELSGALVKDRSRNRLVLNDITRIGRVGNTINCISKICLRCSWAEVVMMKVSSLSLWL